MLYKKKFPPSFNTYTTINVDRDLRQCAGREKRRSDEIRISHQYQRIDLYSLEVSRVRCSDACVRYAVQIYGGNRYITLSRDTLYARTRNRDVSAFPLIILSSIDQSRSDLSRRKRSLMYRSSLTPRHRRFFRKKCEDFSFRKNRIDNFVLHPVLLSSSSFTIVRNDKPERRGRAIPLSIRR